MLVWANSKPWKRACVVAELVSPDLHSDYPSLGRTRASSPVAAAGAVDILHPCHVNDASSPWVRGSSLHEAASKKWD